MIYDGGLDLICSNGDNEKWLDFGFILKYNQNDFLMDWMCSGREREELKLCQDFWPEQKG